MNSDKSIIMYEKIETLKSPKVKITLNDGTFSTGFISGFFHGTVNYIDRWEIQESTINNSKNNFFLNNSDGKIINQNDIAEVYFYEDNSLLIF